MQQHNLIERRQVSRLGGPYTDSGSSAKWHVSATAAISIRRSKDLNGYTRQQGESLKRAFQY
jgi:hypothetical protein